MCVCINIHEGYKHQSFGCFPWTKYIIQASMSSMTGDHFAIAYREGSFLLLALSQSLWQHRNDGIVRAMLVCGFFEVSSPSFEAYLRFVKCVRRGSPTTDWHQESHLGGPWQSWNQERGCGMVNLVQWHPKLTSWELLQLNPPQTNQLGAEKTTNSGWFIITKIPTSRQTQGVAAHLLPKLIQKLYMTTDEAFTCLGCNIWVWSKSFKLSMNSICSTIVMLIDFGDFGGKHGLFLGRKASTTTSGWCDQEMPGSKELKVQLCFLLRSKGMQFLQWENSPGQICPALCAFAPWRRDNQTDHLGTIEIPPIKTVMTWGWFVALALPHAPLIFH